MTIANPLLVRILWEWGLFRALLGKRWRRDTLRNWRRAASIPPERYVRIDGEWYAQ